MLSGSAGLGRRMLFCEFMMDGMYWRLVRRALDHLFSPIYTESVRTSVFPAHADRLFYHIAVPTTTFGVNRGYCKNAPLSGLVTPSRTGDSAPTDEEIRGRRRSKP